jgi:hypothetical protein
MCITQPAPQVAEYNIVVATSGAEPKCFKAALNLKISSDGSLRVSGRWLYVLIPEYHIPF